MAKAFDWIQSKKDGTEYRKGVAIFCPGCNTYHIFDDGRWTFNGDYEKPTFSPSMLCNATCKRTRCHSFVRDGKIQFLSDCVHELKNKTVDLPEV